MNRFIPVETHTAATNMALDEACMEAVKRGEVPLTIRLYRWKPSAVSIGNFQCLHDELDINACEKAGIDIVRRETGGGAVYHDIEGEVTYSIIGPVEAFPKSIIASYMAICQPIIDALAKLDIRAEFRPINDITIDGRKVSGNAQTRKQGVLLQHGTILLSVDAEKMFTYLTPDKSKTSDKPFIKSVKASVTAISEHSKASRDEIEHAIGNAFKQAYDALPGQWTREEKERAADLANEKYSSKAWTEMR